MPPLMLALIIPETVTVFVAVVTHPPLLVTEYVISDVPDAIPLITPDELTVATLLFELNQVPPVDVLVHISMEPTHKGVVPVMVWGTGAVIVTVSVAVFIQASIVKV